MISSRNQSDTCHTWNDSKNPIVGKFNQGDARDKQQDHPRDHSKNEAVNTL